MKAYAELGAKCHPELDLRIIRTELTYEDLLIPTNALRNHSLSNFLRPSTTTDQAPNAGDSGSQGQEQTSTVVSPVRQAVGEDDAALQYGAVDEGGEGRPHLNKACAPSP